MPKKVKVMSIFGTRPEATKMVPLVKALAAHPNVESIVCVSAQHRQLLDEVINPLGIIPDYDLNLMRQGQSLPELTARVITGMDAIIKEAKPDWVLVHGDTATTMAASLATYFNEVKLGHVEAGLRTYNKYEPFPEEINRRVAGVIADLHFSPTELTRQNLLKENIPAENIFVTGNTGIDLMKHTVQDDYTFQNEDFAKLDYTKQRIILMTAHRRENWGQPMENMFRAIRRLADDFTDVSIVYPVHPNPVVKDCANKLLSGHPRIKLTEPVNVFDLHNMMNRCHMVLTDSSGIQEEAPALNKPVVVMRGVTERPEGEAAGTLVLAGTDETRVYDTVKRLLTNETEYKRMAEAPNPFGDGNASGRIVEAILKW